MDGLLFGTVAKDYNIVVYPSDLAPYGPFGKENPDVIRVIFDLNCYLETDEVVQIIQFPTIVPAPADINTKWRIDYPIDQQPTLPTGSPDDVYPMKIVSQAITSLGKKVEVRLNAGTPGWTYVFSFIVVASDTRRRKEIDTLITIEQPVNFRMLTAGDLDPDIVPPIIVGDSTALPMGFAGLVVLENSGNHTGIIITLPSNPELGQAVEFVDSLGKDGLYPVTFRGDGDVPIDGDGRLTFVSSINYDALRWVWVGTNWHLMSHRFGFLA